MPAEPVRHTQFTLLKLWAGERSGGPREAAGQAARLGEGSSQYWTSGPSGGGRCGSWSEKAAEQGREGGRLQGEEGKEGASAAAGRRQEQEEGLGPCL